MHKCVLNIKPGALRAPGVYFVFWVNWPFKVRILCSFELDFLLYVKIHIPSFVQMGYMTVEEHSSTLLHLKRSPGLRSWSLLVGKYDMKYEINFPKQSHPLSPEYAQTLLLKHLLCSVPVLSLIKASHYNCRYSICWVGSCILQLRYTN